MPLLKEFKRKVSSKLEYRLYRDVTGWEEVRRFRASLPPLVAAYFDSLFAKEKRLAKISLPAGRPKRKKACDILYLGTLKADALKDVIALRKGNPGMRIVALSISPLPKNHFAFARFDETVILRSNSHLVRELFSRQARSLVVQGGDDQPMVFLSCLWTGRLVWQVRDTNLRQPRDLVDELLFQKAKFLAERADAICTFHIAESFASLRGEVDTRTPARMVRPMCVPDLGPKRFLPKLSVKSGTLHVAYAAGIDKVGGNEFRPGIFIRSADQYAKFKAITDQGIHVHVYSPHLMQVRPGWEPYFELAKSSPFFHIEKTLDFEEILPALTQYDLAFSHFTFPDFVLRPRFRYYVSNGYYTFVQARLPIITSPSEPQRTEYLQAYGNGFELDDTEFAGSFRAKAEACLAKTTPELLENCARALEYDYAAFQAAVLGPRAEGSKA